MAWDDAPPAAEGGGQIAGLATRRAAAKTVIAGVVDNHQTRQVLRLAEPVTTHCIELTLLAPSLLVPSALFAIRCYADDRP